MYINPLGCVGGRPLRGGEAVAADARPQRGHAARFRVPEMFHVEHSVGIFRRTAAGFSRRDGRKCFT